MKFIYYRLRRLWCALRHKTYTLRVYVVGPTDGDDTANIQAAIDRAASDTSPTYEDAKKVYELRRIKWLHRKPVLSRITQFDQGVWKFNKPLQLQSNVLIQGNGRKETILKKD